MRRRQFIGRAALGLASAAGMVAAFSYLRQFFPRRAGQRRRIEIGDPGQFPVDTYTFIESHQIYLYRDHEGIKAVSAVCTHLGCILDRSTDGFECPCHGSCYDEQGKVLSGPAPRDLAWYRVGRTYNGKIVVDPGTTVPSGEKFLIT